MSPWGSGRGGGQREYLRDLRELEGAYKGALLIKGVPGGQGDG